MSFASERASPAKEQRAGLRSEKGGMCHLAEVMTHAAALLHLHRPWPRKCCEGERREQPGWPQKGAHPALGSPAAPAPTAGHSWLRLLRRPERSEPPGAARGGEPCRGSLLRASSLRPFVCVG